MAALRRAVDREVGLHLLTEAVADIPGVTSVHVTVREGEVPEPQHHGASRSTASTGSALGTGSSFGTGSSVGTGSALDGGPTSDGESGTESEQALAAGVLVVRQAGDIPSTWPSTSHTWRPGPGDRALHHALLSGRAWEGMIGPDGTDRSVPQSGRRFAAALPVLGERGAVAQVLLTSAERLDERLIGLAHVLAAAAGPVLSSPLRAAAATPTDEAVSRVARSLASAAATGAPVALVSARLLTTRRLREELGGDAVLRARTTLREILARKNHPWRDRAVLQGEDGEFFVVVTDVSPEDVLLRIGELREEARQLIGGVDVQWGCATVTDHAVVVDDLRVSAAALIAVTRAARDADGAASRVDSGSFMAAQPPDPEQLVQLVDDVLNELDSMLDVPLGERVAAVASRAAECVDAAAWQVSVVQGDIAQSHRLEILRPVVNPAGRGPLFGKIDYPLSGRPAMSRAAEGSAFNVTLGAGDVAERLSLAMNGLTSEVAAGGYDPDAHRWLIELYGDAHSREVSSVGAVLLALVQAALGFPRAISPVRHAD